MKDKKRTIIYTILSAVCIGVLFYSASKYHFGILSQLKEIADLASEDTGLISIEEYIYFENIITAVIVAYIPQISVLLVRRGDKKTALYTAIAWIVAMIISVVMFANYKNEIGLFNISDPTIKILMECFVIMVAITTLGSALLPGPWNYASVIMPTVLGNILKIVFIITLSQITIFLAASVLLMLF